MTVAVRHGRTRRRALEADDLLAIGLIRPRRCHSSRTAAQVVRRPSSSSTSGRQPSSRAARDTSSTLRRASPCRGASWRRSRVTHDGATELVQPVDARLDARPDVERAAVPACCREQRTDDIGDVDEVPRLLAVAVDDGPSPAAIRSRKIAITPPSSEADCRGPYVREAKRGRAKAVDPAPCLDVRLGGELRRAVRRDRAEVPRPPGRAVDVAVDRAARRGEHDRRAEARAASRTLTVPTTFTLASNASRSTDVPTSAWAARWKTRSASVSNGSRMSCSTKRAASFTNAAPVERSSRTVTASPRATGRRRGASR